MKREHIEKIFGRTPDKAGDEGRIYFFGRPENPLVLKEWYTTQDLAGLKKRFGRDIPISPHFHKAQFYEMSLIHDLFPDHTVGIVGGADFRIKPGAEGIPHFSPQDRAPITVLQRADFDPALATIMDDIVSQAYADFAARRIEIAAGAPNDFPERIKRWDERVMDTFGVELEDTMRNSGAFRQPDRSYAIEMALEYARSRKVESVVIPMLEHGIAPSHPAMNFVPNTRKEGLKPYGRFVELQIIDAHRLEQQLKQRKDADHELRKLRRFVIFQGLDFAYSRLFRDSDQSVIDDAQVQAHAFTLLRAAERFLTSERNASMRVVGFRNECSIISERFGKDKQACIEAIDALTVEMKASLERNQFTEAVNSIFESIPLLAAYPKDSPAYNTFIRLMVYFVSEHPHVIQRRQVFLIAFGALRGSVVPDAELAQALERIADDLGIRKR